MSYHRGCFCAKLPSHYFPVSANQLSLQYSWLSAEQSIKVWLSSIKPSLGLSNIWEDNSNMNLPFYHNIHQVVNPLHTCTLISIHSLCVFTTVKSLSFVLMNKITDSHCHHNSIQHVMIGIPLALNPVFITSRSLIRLRSSDSASLCLSMTSWCLSPRHANPSVDNSCFIWLSSSNTLVYRQNTRRYHTIHGH